MTGVDAAAIPLSLYLHFPWCVAKCPYCDFNSHGLRGAVPEDAYIAALIRDLDFELLQPESRPIQSIFMGGGTPSLFSGRAIASVLEAFAKRLSFAPDIEITLEANPGTVDAGYFRDYRTAGVNRLSIGVQSLNDAMLKRLGRIHGHDDAVSAVRIARAAGFDNLNLDLMFALPEQSEAEAAADLREAIALGPEHLSYYQLTLEPNTEFAARPPKLPDDDAAWAMQLAGQALLAEHGYAQYEVSAYAQAGRQSRHNRNYWQFGDYLGIGAGAHGKRTFADRIERRARHKLPKTYQAAAGQASALQEQRDVSAPELPFEFAMNALRLNEGFSPALFEARTGLARSEIGPRLAKLAARGLLEQDDAVILPTALGRAHLNTLISEFL
ncbi:radical SAM family heme chaperone HemW [Nevskia ramosa]|uniref:radical SAM family heme chaperone HemW n=1 Tax=Nevskia ramosa TaxID=64002 RepID=UPI003D0A1C9D